VSGATAVLSESILRQTGALETSGLHHGEDAAPYDIEFGDVETSWTATSRDGAYDVLVRGRTPYPVMRTSSARLTAIDLATQILPAFTRRRLVPKALAVVPPRGVEVIEWNQGIEIRWDGEWAQFETERFLPRALTLVHLAVSDQDELVRSVNERSGAPLLRSRDDADRELAARGADPEIFLSFGKWRSWVVTARVVGEAETWT
jgi:hypothetical protein